MDKKGRGLKKKKGTLLAHVIGPVFEGRHARIYRDLQGCCIDLEHLGRSVDLQDALAKGGTDSHLVLWDLRPNGLTCSKVDKR